MRKILTIEGSDAVARNVCGTLEAGGISTDLARSGRTGLARLTSGEYDAVILNKILPDLDGLTVVSAIRGIGLQVPLLMISSARSAKQRIEGLRAGADDCMSMPFSFDELLARTQALLRRGPNASESPATLRVGAIELDLVKRIAVGPQAELALQPTEFRLLELMMRQAGHILTRTVIFEEVWQRRFDPNTNLIDVHVARLRKKIDALGTPGLIRTIRGSGYRLG